MTPNHSPVAPGVQPPPDPSRIVFVDVSTGILTQAGFWFLYLLFIGGQNAEGLAILEAFDGGTETALTPLLNQLRIQAAMYFEQGPEISKDQLAEVFKLSSMESAGGVTRTDLEEAMALEIMGAELSLAPRIDALEALWAMESGSSEGSAKSTGTNTIDTHTLTAASTNIVASVAPTANSVLIVKLIADATGGRTVTWDAASFLYAPGGFTLLSNERATVIFAADMASGKWEQAAPVQVRL